jgi:hypothetical protein
MDMRTVVPETARIARVEAFPAEGDNLHAITEIALVARIVMGKFSSVRFNGIFC